jgi:UDP-galactopyranose mutase
MGYKADLLIVGAGFAGSVFARCAADAGFSVHLIDQREHTGGNSYSYKDPETGIEIHKYGPHIFHTDSKEIWDFVNRFSGFLNYTHKVKANCNGRVYQMPINLYTINQFFGKAFTPAGAEKFIDGLRVKVDKVENFRDYILSELGGQLYEAFFRHYTIKQWGKLPEEIPASTAKRLPIRFNYDDNYYFDYYQGIPEEGYAKIFDRMLEHPLIKVMTLTPFELYRAHWRENYKKLVFTGSPDDYFNFEFGALPYRTVRFEEIREKEIIGAPVMNFTGPEEKFTRICEFKWFTPRLKFNSSVGYKEFSDFTDSKKNPIYPIRDGDSENIYKKYEELAEKEPDVVFIGRLAEFRYYDMHQVIGSAISKFKKFAGK